jgi:tRNA-Thr(GGU) m(6)t(6)A37 methyltransferase TsaA
MKRLELKQIGTIHSPFTSPQGMPIQPAGAVGVKGRVEVFQEFEAALEDLSGFSHIYLLYYFHLAKSFALKVKPFMDRVERGLFATRAPSRPNPIGISVVRLVGVDRNVLHVLDIDIVDQTPLLDIKPYVPEFDVRHAERIGWMQAAAEKAADVRSDARFSKD